MSEIVIVKKFTPFRTQTNCNLCDFLLIWTVEVSFGLSFDNINYQTKNVDVDNQRTKVNKPQCKLFIQGQVIINREEYRAHGIK